MRRVAQVYYAGLEDHPQHELAKRQMDGFGAVVSAASSRRRGRARERLLNALELFTIAESLGGVESLAGFPPLMSHSAMTPEARENAGITGNLVRLSCGIEDARRPHRRPAPGAASRIAGGLSSVFVPPPRGSVGALSADDPALRARIEPRWRLQRGGWTKHRARKHVRITSSS